MGSLRDQLKYASKKGIPLVIFADSRDFENDTIILKNITTGTQQVVTCDHMIEAVKKELSFIDELSNQSNI